jgi:hypothetical protein
MRTYENASAITEASALPKSVEFGCYNSFVFNGEKQGGIVGLADFRGFGRPQPRVVVFGQSAAERSFSELRAPVDISPRNT